MFKFNDRLPHLLMPSVIYQYSCRQCSSSYVGQTVKQFKVRIYHNIKDAPIEQEIINHVPIIAKF